MGCQSHQNRQLYESEENASWPTIYEFKGNNIDQKRERTNPEKSLLTISVDFLLELRC